MECIICTSKDIHLTVLSTIGFCKECAEDACKKSLFLTSNDQDNLQDNLIKIIEDLEYDVGEIRASLRGETC